MATDAPASLSCDRDYDFIVRSIPDGATFRASAECLQNHSEVFANMFECHVRPPAAERRPDGEDDVLSLDEPAATIQVLLRLLHTVPPGASPSPSAPHAPGPSPGGAPAIPFPLLPPLFALADKYMLSGPIVQGLCASLAAYTSEQPLRVYAYAVQFGLRDLAAEASSWLLLQPLAAYTPEEVAVIPTVRAYHQLVQLHAFRISRLREVLQGEPIFPHGYGECAKHSRETQLLWEQQKRSVIAEIHAGTNVAAEMAKLSANVAGCPACSKAFRAAVEMLNYKCGKIPRGIDRLPSI
ncbi:hypothetical protein OBBRIDRAFT_787210 [Obba rivulosa]|uniref:BTB domain-containing protein n=1 Tax=Obba rivulosa TaxID=1052685 RepID=A0A8E2DV75_9APHY|nr:hypothetical protein OBBRIDRAFT_787210 [Obba rivulosa]